MAVTRQENSGKNEYFKACDKSGNFTLSQGKFTCLKEVRESEVSSKYEIVQFILAIFLVRDGDTFLFNVDHVHCLE